MISVKIYLYIYVVSPREVLDDVEAGLGGAEQPRRVLQQLPPQVQAAVVLSNMKQILAQLFTNTILFKRRNNAYSNCDPSFSSLSEEWKQACNKH